VAHRLRWAATPSNIYEQINDRAPCFAQFWDSRPEWSRCGKLRFRGICKPLSSMPTAYHCASAENDLGTVYRISVVRSVRTTCCWRPRPGTSRPNMIVGPPPMPGSRFFCCFNPEAGLES